MEELIVLPTSTVQPVSRRGKLACRECSEACRTVFAGRYIGLIVSHVVIRNDPLTILESSVGEKQLQNREEEYFSEKKHVN